MSRVQSIRFRAAVALVALACASFCYAKPLAGKRAKAIAQFDYAQKLRDDLNALPRSERTAHDFQRVVQAFRKVYLITAASGRADSGLEAAAEVLAQEGRQLGDPEISRDAIKQYQFLITQYPGTRWKPQVMFAIGKIYQDDLGDYSDARTAYEEFLHAHPLHPLSPQAREALAKMGPGQPQATTSTAPSASVHQVEVAVPGTHAQGAASGAAVTVQPAKLTAPAAAPSRAELTALHFWSAPDYTRIEIALQGDATYEAGRIPAPERVFFDLHGARISPEMRPREFDVNDGLVRRIRIAEFQPGTARVVLEVAEGSDFSAHWAQNPSRLIVDIRPRAPSNPSLLAENSAVPPIAALPKPVGKAHAQAARPMEATAKTAKLETASVGHAQPRPPVIAAAPTPVVKNPSANSELGTGWSSSKPQPTVAEVSIKHTLPMDFTSKPAGAPAALHPASSTAVSATAKPRVPEVDEVAPMEQALAKKEVVGREAAPEAGGGRTLIRALGLKIGKIVIDPGHGGHDTGTIGPHGLEEKDLVLDVALRLGKLLQDRMGSDVVYTRKDDTFVPLQERTAIANQANADLFISIHANSSRDTHARGVEVYYLNFTSSADALEVAARENASSDDSIHDLQDLVKQIALQEKVDESREFAADVDRALHVGLSDRGRSMRDRGVKKAPFVVLIGAHMPSILAEISFLSNPKDERLLEKPAYRQKIAEALYRGVSQYAGGLGGVKLASARASGQ